MTKKRRRHTPEQIIRKLEEGQRQLASGMELDEVCEAPRVSWRLDGLSLGLVA